MFHFLSLIASGLYVIGLSDAACNASTYSLSPFAGAGTKGFADGPRLSALFAEPQGLAFDGHDLFVADTSSNRLRRVSATDVSTLPGVLRQPRSVTTDARYGVVWTSPARSASGRGFADGPAASAQFHNPSGVAVARDGAIYVADSSNNRIRKLSADRATVTTVAGSATSGDDDGDDATFNVPIGLVLHRDALYITDLNNHALRRLDLSTNEISTLDFDAELQYPHGVARDRCGNLYVADTYNDRVLKIDPVSGAVVVLGDVERPVGVAVNAKDGSVYVSSPSLQQILRFAPSA
ncbi:hypothetical protein SPRG_12263 [Saprolegnia parasitica CBS 223.65]|uniref:SMP-30/Gluconolactonase/LRE-like region domain-containing protein n=1 Tax=Saprolegnia parasitica (strain CBS 223.65) TaxID=695850 RepID=A0A067BVS7_SAPPC|nr:hypothetical protein SPRG_12263 [Saprolegnia parasitica CBS 223.65]KDO22624.1 hypothetical protein SPRG_12263 [Saprolegnia parasitica CBS 223.65]|eukprot:XP_012206643.1 hypothetical protein SPRG_12263 [Saprolegnia parasitica CBS 223.65]